MAQGELWQMPPAPVRRRRLALACLPLRARSTRRRARCFAGHQLPCYPGAPARACQRHQPPAARRPPQEVWGAGCVTLVGDAAHAMLPMLGQGASQAMESAVALAVVRPGKRAWCALGVAHTWQMRLAARSS